jgi:colicin import membrane protein
MHLFARTFLILKYHTTHSLSVTQESGEEDEAKEAAAAAEAQRQQEEAQTAAAAAAAATAAAAEAARREQEEAEAAAAAEQAAEREMDELVKAALKRAQKAALEAQIAEKEAALAAAAYEESMNTPVPNIMVTDHVEPEQAETHEGGQEAVAAVSEQGMIRQGSKRVSVMKRKPSKIVKDRHTPEEKAAADAAVRIALLLTRARMCEHCPILANLVNSCFTFW